MEDQFYFDNEDEDVSEDGYYLSPTAKNEDDEEEQESEEIIDDVTSDTIDPSLYSKKMTKEEMWLCTAYDDIVTASKKSDEKTYLGDILLTIVLANPKHTSSAIASNIVKDLLQKQGHNRLVSSVYVPDSEIRGEDVDEDLLQDESSSFNRKFSQEARDYMARFIEYLANRDLSKDSVVSRKRKQRQLPALIIYLFSNGLYDLILNCPTMPKEYADQITRALEKIIASKYDIVEELANRYEEAGRPQVAERVRKMQLSWFKKEPAEIRTSTEYADLGITYEDVLIYREYRSKYTNVSKAITQENISDLIEVVVDKDAHIYEKLKDKTRSDAIADVKQVLKDWSKENPIDSDLAGKIIWKD